MIKGHCRTNLDDINHEWPTVFAEVPKIGDRVKAVKIVGSNFCSCLKVVGITHTAIPKRYPGTFTPNGEWEPCIEVELNK